MDDRGVIVSCSCGQANRLAFDRLAKPARCGRCQAPLQVPAEPVEVPTPAAFDALIRRSVLPVVVDFWAPWCGPCRFVAPELQKVAASNRGRWLVVKVNTEELPELGERFGIRSIPTMAVFAGGREITRSAGARPAADIERFVGDALAGREI
jgi:thioredoxin 2